MKNTLRLLITVCLILCISVLALSACNNTGDPTPTPDPTPDPTPEPEPDEGTDGVLTLIDNGAAKFTIVRTGDLKSAGVKKANALHKELGNLGLDVGELAVDNDAEAVREYEIVIGSGARLREGCNVDYHTLGKDGYIIKVVGNRVIIAGGTDEMLCEAVDLFRTEVLGITGDLTDFEGRTVTIKTDTVYAKESFYDLMDIRIGERGASLMKGYYLSYDTSNDAIKTVAHSVRSALYESAGLWLPLESDLPAGESAKHRFVVREVADAGEGGFRVFVDEEDNLIMECSFLLHMDRGASAFLNEYVVGKTGVSRIYADEPFEYAVNVVRYTEFGAKGDGKTDDFYAMLRTHEYANLYGIKVLEDQGLTYYINEWSHGREIIVHTDVDLGEAKFIIDDRDLTPDMGGGKFRSMAIFAITPSEKCVGTGLSEDQLEGISLQKGDTNVGLTFDEAKLLSLYYEGKKIYVRYGANANAGSATSERIIVDAQGNIDPTTPLTFNYPSLDACGVYSLDETPITFEGGIFTTYANRLCYEFTYGGYVTGDQYYGYGRNITITRSNTTVKNVEHYIEKEENGGYPYNGFFNISNCANVLISDCIVTGHRAYTEDRDGGDGSTPDGIIQPSEIDTGTTMGSYDLIVGSAINATFRNIRQSNSITSNYYWGIMGSNFGRNVVYEGCYLSRFDAHCGVYNATVRDTTIGFAINLTGDGDFYLENVQKLVGSTLISLREDYGSTWNGRIFLKNVHMAGYRSVSFAECDKSAPDKEYNLISGRWYDHEFGNEVHLPYYVEIDGFTTGSNDPRVVVNIFNYPSLTAASVASKLNPFHVHADTAVALKNCQANIKFYISSTRDYVASLFESGAIADRSENGKKVELR